MVLALTRFVLSYRHKIYIKIIQSSLILSDRCTITCGCKTVVKGVTFIMEHCVIGTLNHNIHKIAGYLIYECLKISHL